MKHPALLRYFSRLARLGLVAALLGLLAACASPITARVTSFNQWPANAAGSTFSYVSRTDNTRELEQATYESYVQTELEKRGLVRAPAGQVGRMQVDVNTSNRSEQKTYLQPIYQDNYVYVPGYRDAAGRIFPGFWTLDPFGPRYVGDRADQHHAADQHAASAGCSIHRAAPPANRARCSSRVRSLKAKAAATNCRKSCPIWCAPCSTISRARTAGHGWCGLTAKRAR